MNPVEDEEIILVLLYCLLFISGFLLGTSWYGNNIFGIGSIAILIVYTGIATLVQVEIVFGEQR